MPLAKYGQLGSLRKSTCVLTALLFALAPTVFAQEQPPPSTTFQPTLDAGDLWHVLRHGRADPLAGDPGASAPTPSRDHFFVVAPTIGSKRVFALSSTVHATVLASCLFMAAFNLAPRAASLKLDDQPADQMRLVFLMTPGPGGGGGGGGLVQKAPPPKALREGHKRISSPLPIRREPKPVVPVPEPPKPPPPPPPLAAETLPTLVAPIITAPADTRNRVGVLQESAAENDSHGPGKGGGAGTGKGTGLGEGDGSGVGPGSVRSGLPGPGPL